MGYYKNLIGKITIFISIIFVIVTIFVKVIPQSIISELKPIGMWGFPITLQDEVRYRNIQTKNAEEYIHSKEFISLITPILQKMGGDSGLKCPSTAIFKIDTIDCIYVPSLKNAPNRLSTNIEYNPNYKNVSCFVQGTLDAQNSFGAMIRTRFAASIEYNIRHKRTINIEWLYINNN